MMMMMFGRSELQSLKLCTDVALNTCI